MTERKNERGRGGAGEEEGTVKGVGSEIGGGERG